MSDLLKDNKELMTEWDYSKNQNIDLNKLVIGSNKKVWWIGKCGHSWDDSPAHRVRGTKCPICSNHRTLEGYNDLATTNPDLLKEWDYTKNEIKPTEVTNGSAKKVWWICSKNHSYEQIIHLKTKGYGCPICSNNKVLAGYNDLATTNPDLLKEWDYTKNEIKPTEVTSGSSKKAWWICNECKNNYENSISNKTKGQGCPYCAGKKVKVGYNDLYTYCINNRRNDLINEFDKKKNSLTPKDITIGSGKQIWWICPKGHSYHTTISARIKKGSGCGICSHKILKKGFNDLQTTHPEIAKEWDYKKNKNNPDEVMAGSPKKYWFICPKGHSYLSSLANRKKGQNCPKCNTEKHTSFPEKAITFYLKKFFTDVEESYHNLILGTKEIDIYLPSLKFGIEYDGVAWHKESKRDLSKDIICFKNDITLLRIREEGCKDYNSNSIKKYIATHSSQALNDAIDYIFKFLNKKYKLDMKVDIDVDRDRIKIMELMNLTEKNNSIAIKAPDIKKYWNYDKNGKITPEQISHSSKKRLFFKCSNGHEWESSAHNFYTSPGCPICSGFTTLKGYNDLFTTNPELKSQWSIKNTIDPTTIRKGSNKKVWWICPTCKNEYDMIVQAKALGRACPYCSNNRIKKGYNDLATTNPKILKEWNYKKNKVKPEEVMNNSNEKVWWICEKCGNEWETKIRNRCIMNRGCPKCGIKKQVETLKINQLNNKGSLKDNYPSLLKEWNYKKNNELGINPEEIVSGSNKKVWWICKKCGNEWEAAIINRTGEKKNGCPKCGIEKVKEIRSKKVGQYTLDGKLVKIYCSASEAIRQTGITSLHRACRGEYGSSGGFIWKYIDEEK